MPNWLALFVAPSLALANLSITYALVTPSCAHQNTVAAHVLSGVMLLACLAMSGGAWRNWRRAERGDTAGDAAGDGVQDRPPFVALVAACVGALSSLAVLALWFPVWVLSPCAS
jgi:Na+/H+-translocating membrane pyrophosphatase